MGSFFSFLFFTALVGVVTYYRTRHENLESSKGYFLGGQSLNGWVIAASLLMTNLSAANFTGMTAMVYGNNLSSIGWTVTVIPPLIFFSFVVLPRFLRGGFTTIPEFLAVRFGPDTRRLVTVLFLSSYILCGMPVALYGGSIAIMQLFNVPALLGLSEVACVWLLVWSLGLVGGIYALYGGLKGVAISDTLYGAGLVLGGILVLIFGISAVGHGHFLDGLHTMLTTHTGKLDAVGSQADLLPFGVLFTGVLVNNLYYWCTNQYIIQRAFGARSLREGQKGVLIAGFFKIMNIFYIAVPGVIAFHLYGANRFANNDWVYPTLIRDTMPSVFVGFFAAVIFGSVFSSFNAVLNSTVTLFAIDIYRPLRGSSVSDAQVVTHSKRIGLGIALVTMVIAPFIMRFQGGIFQYMTKVGMLFGVPVLLILLLGFFTRGVSGRVANLTLLLFLVSFGLPLFGFVQLPLHYLHVLGLLFVFFGAFALGLARVWPPARPAAPPAAAPAEIDLRPWEHRRLVGALAVLAMILTYVVFSPLGLAQAAVADKQIDYGFVAAGLLTGAGIIFVLWRRGRDVPAA